MVDVYRKVVQIDIGSSSDLWGVSLTPAAVNAGIYFLVRRPAATIGDGFTEDSTLPRLIDYMRLTAHHNPSGGSLTMERMTALQRALIGKETTRGTAVAATQRLMSFKVLPNAEGDVKGWAPMGDKLESEQMLMKEWGTASIDGVPCYRELGVVLASAIQKPVSSGAGAGSKNVHEFRFMSRDQSDFQAYTLEYGESVSRAEKYAYANVTDFDLNFNRSAGTSELKGSMLMQRMADGITMTAGTNEQQTITLTAASSGTFKLKYKGAETTALAYNITTSAMQTALQLLSTGTGLTVSGAAGAWVVTFPTGVNEPFIEVSLNSTNGTFAITETTRGGLLELGRQPILPGHISIYVADTYAGLSSGKLTRCFASGFGVHNVRKAFWALNDASTSFDGHADDMANLLSKITVEADSNGMAYMTSIRANAIKYLRIRATGPLITGSDYYGMDIDLACKFSQMPPITDSDGLVAREWAVKGCFDPTEGFSGIVRLTNDLASY